MRRAFLLHLCWAATSLLLASAPNPTLLGSGFAALVSTLYALSGAFEHSPRMRSLRSRVPEQDPLA